MKSLSAILRRLLCAALCASTLCRPCCGGPSDAAGAGHACCVEAVGGQTRAHSVPRGRGATDFSAADSIPAEPHGCCSAPNLESANAPGDSSSGGSSNGESPRIPGGEHECCRAPSGAATLPSGLRDFERPASPIAVPDVASYEAFAPVAFLPALASEDAAPESPGAGIPPVRGPPTLS